MGDTFKYFGFGSNLLKERILIRNPSAKFCCIGTLHGYKLAFGFPLDLNDEDDLWEGAAATIHPANPDSHIIGCVWEIRHDQMEYLDQQESFYRPLQVPVKLDSGEVVDCRTYQMIEKPDGDTIPNPYYVKVMLDGAKQNGFPMEYIKFIESLPTNKRTEPPPLYLDVVRKLEEFRKLQDKS